MIDKQNLYNEVSNRLWEKLEFYRESINIECVDFKEPFPVDQLIEYNPLVRYLIYEVTEEFDNYGMSEFQCSWAVRQFILGGIKLMVKCNKANGTDMKVRA